MTDYSLSSLAIDAAQPSARFSNLLRRQRYQLGGALLLGLVLPFAIRFGWDGFSTLPNHTHTIGMVLAGIVLSHFLIKQFARYPGESPLTTALPGASMGFGLVVLAIMSTHLAYSRGFLLWGYGTTVAFYALVGFLKSRYFRQKLALVPSEGSAELSRIGRVDWLTLSAPIPVSAARLTQGLVVDLSANLSSEWRNFVLTCGTAGIPVFDSTRAREMMTGQVDLTSLANIGFDALLPHRIYKKVKSVADITAAIALLPLALPVIGAAALAVRLESPGPAFFIQKRVGYRGRIFYCYKLRSMHAAAESAGPSFTTVSDPRVTRVGRFIRKYRIDELPQIFNILKGEMSWIGPRPEAVALAQAYERSIPYYAFRHSVKPGISGWAAVRQGNVAEVDAATAKLRYDFFYIKNLSPSLDALIVAKTVWTMLTGFGSR